MYGWTFCRYEIDIFGKRTGSIRTPNPHATTIRPGDGLPLLLGAWNEFLAALVLMTDQSKFTLPVMMTALQSGRFGAIDWGAVQAGVTVMMVPCLILFLALQRFYIRGLMAGAVK